MFTSEIHYGGNNFQYPFYYMLWRDDPKLQNAVYRKLGNRLTRNIGFDWIKFAIEDCPNQEWDNPEVCEGNIEDICRKARAVATRKDIDTEQKEIQNREYVSSGVGHSYATMLFMQESLEEVRLKYWGKAVPPFQLTQEHRHEAAAWFFTQEEIDASHHPDGLPAIVELDIKLTAKNARQAVDLCNRVVVENSSRDSTGRLCPNENMNIPLELVKALVNEAEVSGSVAFERANYKEPDQFLSLNWFAPKDVRYDRVRAIPGETLGSLYADVQTLAVKSSFWNQEATLYALLFGGAPTAKVGVSLKRPWRDGESHIKFEIKIDAPATPEEVAKTYAKWLEREGLSPKPITNNQSALLQLHFRYPQATWAERYTVWERWCKQHPELKSYRNWRSLCSSCKSALERGKHGWGE